MASGHSAGLVRSWCLATVWPQSGHKLDTNWTRADSIQLSKLALSRMASGHPSQTSQNSQSTSQNSQNTQRMAVV